MAIKGKKKSGNRGSQARRRPASAPRPVSVARRKDPWYNSATGRVVAAILVVLLLAGVGSTIAVVRGNSQETEDKREAVEDYVDELRTVVQETAPAAGAMAQTTGSAPPEQLEALGETAQEWIGSFEAASSKVSGFLPPDDVTEIHPFFLQSLQIYLTAARQMSDAAKLEGNLRAQALTRASEIRAQAESVWVSATGLVDGQLSELDGDPSGLQSPALAGASIPPPVAETPAPDETEGDGGGQGEGEGGNQDEDQSTPDDGEGQSTP